MTLCSSTVTMRPVSSAAARMAAVGLVNGAASLLEIYGVGGAAIRLRKVLGGAKFKPFEGKLATAIAKRTAGTAGTEGLEELGQEFLNVMADEVFTEKDIEVWDRLKDEQGNLLKVIVPPQLNTREVMVIIGQENEAEAIQNCSVVMTLYGLRAEAVGTIGVIGPTRMPYARTIPTVNYLSTVLSQLVAELYGKQHIRNGHQ